MPATTIIKLPVFYGAASRFTGARKNPLPRTPRRNAAPGRDWLHEALLGLKVHGALLTRLKSQDALRVHVATAGRNVTLSGEVRRPASISLVESMARLVRGVRQVNNQLTCAAPEDAEGVNAQPASGTAMRAAEIRDTLLEIRLKRRLLAAAGVGASRIGVQAENGVVKLSGAVPDPARREEALRIIRATGAVREIRDLLKVRPIAAAR